MTYIRNNCPHCQQETRFHHTQIVVLALQDASQHPGSPLSYAYQHKCSECDSIVYKSCPKKIAQLLVRSGAEMKVWTPPDESIPKIDTPLCLDDLIDLHQLLQDPNFITKISSSS